MVASVLVHVAGALIGWCGVGHHAEPGSTSLVDIELAPAAPNAERLPAESFRQYAQDDTIRDLGADEEPDRVVEPGAGGMDAAPPDAAPATDARRRRRADAEAVAATDAAPGDAALVAAGDAAGPIDDAVAVAMTEPGVGSGSGIGSGSGSGSDVAVATGEPATGGVPGTGSAGKVTPGTAANLLAYVPKGHVITAVVRFDRLRGTRWQAPVDLLFKPMPDHITLIPADKGLGDLFDTVVISSPQPQNAIATTLVVRYRQTRPELRAMLDQPDTPVTWMATTGGLFGVRKQGDRTQPDDKRNFVSPWLGWLVLAQPRDLAGMAKPRTADLDTVVASAKLPAWVAGIRAIEDETGTPDGPALVLTLAPSEPRYAVPDVGLDVTSVPGPERITVALEFVKQGFVVRGNLRFRTEPDAIEFVDAVTRARTRLLDSTILKGILSRARALNAVTGLTLDRNGMRVSYATSVSVADADGLLAATAQYLEVWFRERSAEAQQDAE